VVVNGHDHLYERFAQQDPAQNPTSEGIREFVVGTGGESLFNMGTVQPNMEGVDNLNFGVLFLTLHSNSYDWGFRGVNGTVLDSGSTICHAKPGGASPATVGKTASAARFSRLQGPLLAARTASMLAASPYHEQRLRFDVHPEGASLRSAFRHGLPLDVYCSRACDLSVAVGLRRNRQTVTLASYRETETEIPRPSSRVWLPLRRSVASRLSGAHLTLSFVAVDASNERRSVTRTLTLTRR
jgi:hypothetical protein